MIFSDPIETVDRFSLVASAWLKNPFVQIVAFYQDFNMNNIIPTVI